MDNNLNLNFEMLGNSADYTMPSIAIYSAEFDYDFKIFIGHTYLTTVVDSFMIFINDVIRPDSKRTQQYKQSLLDAINNSNSITLNILYKQDLSCIGPRAFSSKSILNDTIIKKYEYIESFRSYMPFGYNDLYYAVDFEALNYKERVCARNLLKKVNRQIYISKRGPKPDSVYKYDKKTGKLLTGYDSVSEASMDSNVSTAAIYQCLSGRAKSSGDFIWARVKLDSMPAYVDERIKHGEVKLTPEQRAERQRERTKQYFETVLPNFLAKEAAKEAKKKAKKT